MGQEIVFYPVLRVVNYQQLIAIDIECDNGGSVVKTVLNCVTSFMDNPFYTLLLSSILKPFLTYPAF